MLAKGGALTNQVGNEEKYVLIRFLVIVVCHAPGGFRVSILYEFVGMRQLFLVNDVLYHSVCPYLFSCPCLVEE